MKKNLLAFIIVLISAANSFSQFNLQLLGHLNLGTSCAGVWHYVDSHGNEYALVGAGNGIAIVDVTDPANPDLKFTAPAANSLWRELKTYNNYCYATTEGGGGITIVNLEYLPDSIQSKVYTGDGTIAGQISSAHTCEIADGYLYIFGAAPIGNGGAIICNIANDPWNPVFTGEYEDNYVHDGYIRNDTLWAGEIYAGQFSIIDVTDKSNPVLLATQQTPGQFCHNTWLSDNGQYLYTTDEVPNAPLGVYDVSDISNIRLVGTYFTDSMPGAEVHNVRVLNDFLVNPSYGSQMTIVDAARPLNLIEVANYRTGTSLCWDASPWLPSGNIIATDEFNGLYVFAPYYERACYLEGLITDSITGAPLNNATVKILGTTKQKQSDITGNYKTGYSTAGNYDIEFSKPGYVSRTITNVSLASGVLTQLDVKLLSFSVEGLVVEAGTGNLVTNANVRIDTQTGSVNLVADANGYFTTSAINSGNHIVTAGKWGYATACNFYNLPSVGPIVITLQKGYTDDFTFDFGWTVSGNATGGMWERGEPTGTTGAVQFNPELDAGDDCTDLCFVTGNTGGSPVNGDVDNGFTELTSPVMSLTTFTDPYLNYERWFVDASSITNNADTLFINLSNGVNTALIEMVHTNNTATSVWVSRSFRISDYIQPSTNMQLTISVSDKTTSESLLESGFDNFIISEGPLAVSEISATDKNISVFPNPFSDVITIKNKDTEITAATLTDVTGRIVKYIDISSGNKTDFSVNLSSLQKGIYILVFTTKEKSYTRRVVKI